MRVAAAAARHIPPLLRLSTAFCELEPAVGLPRKVSEMQKGAIRHCWPCGGGIFPPPARQRCKLAVGSSPAVQLFVHLSLNYSCADYLIHLVNPFFLFSVMLLTSVMFGAASCIQSGLLVMEQPGGFCVRGRGRIGQLRLNRFHFSNAFPLPTARPFPEYLFRGIRIADSSRGLSEAFYFPWEALKQGVQG